MAYDIFISYRRDGGKEWARSLKSELDRRGYRVFWDFDELKDGIFDRRIMDAIDSSPIFIVLLSPHALDRCVNEDDGVRREIEYALLHDRHVVPIDPDRSFSGFPPDIPEELKKGLGQYQFSEVMFGQLFMASIDKMVHDRIEPLLQQVGRASSHDTKPLSRFKLLSSQTMNHDVFISYSSKNKTTALAICHVLEEHRIRCWMAPRDIPHGADYGDVIDEAIVSCRLFILVFSGPATLSQWVKGELNLAFTERKIIIPYRIDETPLKGAMRLILNQTHWIEAYPDAATRFGELVEAAERFLGRSVTSEQSAVSEAQSAAFEPVVPNPTPAILKTYKIGDYYNANGKEGIVFEVDATGHHGKIMAMHDLPEELAWCTEKTPEKVGTSDEENGMKNMEIICRIPGWREKYPVFAACAALGKGWYLPAKEELEKLNNNKGYLSEQAEKFSGSSFKENEDWNVSYWSSTEASQGTAWNVFFKKKPSYLGHNDKSRQDYLARAITTF